MTIKQLSVFVENKPGRLSEITDVLFQNGIDIRALSIADTTNFGILRLIVTTPDLAEKVLKEAGFTVSQTDVIAIGVSDEPGGLNSALHHLAGENVAVEYIYAFVSRTSKTAYVILSVNDCETALACLKKNNVPILGAKDIESL